METAEPEGDDVDVSEYTVQGTVRVVRTCADCGDELKECSFDVSVNLETLTEENHKPSDDEEGEQHEMTFEVDSCEATESGGGRYAKNMIGFELRGTVTCSCGAEETIEASDSAAASSFDELV